MVRMWSSNNLLRNCQSLEQVLEEPHTDNLCAHWFMEYFTEFTAPQRRCLWKREIGRAHREQSWDKEEE